MSRLGDAIMRGIALGLQLSPDFFEKQYRGAPYWVVRVIHYPPLPARDGGSSDAHGEDAASRALAGATFVGRVCITLLSRRESRQRFVMMQKSTIVVALPCLLFFTGLPSTLGLRMHVC